ncbi:hypothetical protein [Iodidimonas sp. SYSU 1G8]|uniref:alpha/beta hydrolase family protein n=1 Tax=Iodidimonas sp. SYSU 1G8 TaxID=3133967 RepID=UPI0031FE5634
MAGSPGHLERSVRLRLRYTPALRPLSRAVRLWRRWVCAGPRAREPYMGDRAAVPITTDEIVLRDNSRDIGMTCIVVRPAVITAPMPVVIYSVPMDWDPKRPTPWGRHIAEHLAAHGYLALHLRHTDADRFIFPETVISQPNKAAYARAQVHKPETHGERFTDIGFLLDTLTAWNEEGELRGWIDLERIGISGHSFGSVTAQALAGLRFPPLGRSYKDSRIKAMLTYSGITLKPDINPGAFADIDVPALYMTGTEDFPQSVQSLPEDKLWPFYLGRQPDRYAVILKGADHHAYHAGRAELRQVDPRERLCYQWVRSISLAFWNAYLRGDGGARDWLDHDLPRVIRGEGRAWRA